MKDVWANETALGRQGWSEVRWRSWLELLQEEVARWSAWWQLVELWRMRIWGGVVGGSKRSQMTYEAMREEEAARRLIWNWEMRREGWGSDATVWLQAWNGRFFEWGLEAEVEACRESAFARGPVSCAAVR